MSDEQPKRFKGAKHLEAGYRAGFSDGYARGFLEVRQAEDLQAAREREIQKGLAQLRAEQQAKPKRTRRTKANGATRETEDTTNANVAHDRVTGDRS